MIVRPVIQYVYSDFAEGITKTQIRRLFDAGQPLSIYTCILNRGTTEAVYVQYYTHCYFTVSCRFV